MPECFPDDQEQLELRIDFLLSHAAKNEEYAQESDRKGNPAGAEYFRGRAANCLEQALKLSE